MIDGGVNVGSGFKISIEAITNLSSTLVSLVGSSALYLYVSLT